MTKIPRGNRKLELEHKFSILRTKPAFVDIIWQDQETIFSPILFVMGKPPADLEHQTQGVSGVRPQHLAVRQWVLDNLCLTREPPVKASTFAACDESWWQDRVTNTAVLEKAGSLSMHLMLCQRQLQWLEHVHPMEDGRIPKNLLERSASLGMPPCRPPSSPLQGRLASGTWNWRTSTQTARKSSQMTEMAGVMLYVMVSGEERRRRASSWRTNGQNLKRDSKPWALTSHPTLCATTVAETAMLGLDCWATPGAALNRKTDPTGRTPLSPETDYYYYYLLI